jgi:hypothetical protein
VSREIYTVTLASSHADEEETTIGLALDAEELAGIRRLERLTSGIADVSLFVKAGNHPGRQHIEDWSK